MFGGKVKATTPRRLRRPGVKVLAVGGNAVAVVADTWWRAKTALDALAIDWDFGEHAKASSAAFAQVLKAGLDAPQAVDGNRIGDVKQGLATPRARSPRCTPTRTRTTPPWNR